MILDETGVGRFQVVPAAYIFFRRGADVLLQLRRNTGYLDGHWAAASAGHVEAGETAFEAACREAREELGLDIRPTQLRPVTAMHRTGATGLAIDERVDFFFVCEEWEGEPRLLEPEKAEALEWFPLDGLPHPVAPHELSVLEGLREGTLPPVVTYGF